MAVADSWTEGGGRGDVLPVGCLEAGLLLPLLVPLLHLTLAHPAGGQRDDVITTHYGSCGKTNNTRQPYFTLDTVELYEWEKNEARRHIPCKEGTFYLAKDQHFFEKIQL